MLKLIYKAPLKAYNAVNVKLKLSTYATCRQTRPP
jgi:hypothetical protein